MRTPSYNSPETRSATLPQEGALPPGELVGPYELGAVLGQGGMGTVYRARHRQLLHTVALKVLNDHSPALQARLLAEGRVQAALQHPNIVRVTDVLEHHGRLVLVMEHVDGPDLRTLLRQEPLPEPEALELFARIVQGVGAAHTAGVVHRDIKPSNVLLQRVDGRWEPRVADFGIARILDEEDPTHGRVQGSLGWVAPERLRGAKDDPRSDIWALGCLLVVLLGGGNPPPSAQSGVRWAQDTLPSTLAPALRALVIACLSMDPRDRPASCAALADALRRAQAPPPQPGTPADPPSASTLDLPRLPRPWRWPALALALLAGGVAWRFWPPEPAELHVQAEPSDAALEVWLEDAAGARHPPGRLRPGDWTLRVRFEGDTQAIQIPLALAPGSALRVVCDPRWTNCFRCGSLDGACERSPLR